MCVCALPSLILVKHVEGEKERKVMGLTYGSKGDCEQTAHSVFLVPSADDHRITFPLISNANNKISHSGH